MKVIENITDYPLQIQTVVLDNGTSFSFTIYYVPLQAGWFITNLTYNEFVLNSVRITNNPNMLYQWRNKLPFGIGCFTDGNREPTQQEDFLSGASKLYLLSETEVEAYKDYIEGGALPS